MFNDQKQYLQQYQVVSDMICISILYFVLTPFFLKITIYFSFPVLFEPKLLTEFYKTSLYFKLSPIIILIPFLLFVLKRYEKVGIQKTGIICYQTFILSFICAGFLFFVFSILNSHVISNIFFSVGSGILLWFALILNRSHIAYLIKNSSSNQNLIKHILIVGTGDKAVSIARHIKFHPGTGLRLVGFLTQNENEIGSKIENKPVVGKVRDVGEVIQNHYMDCVLYAGEPEYEQDYIFLFTACSVRGVDFATTKPIPKYDSTSHIQIFQENINSLPIKIIKFVCHNPRHFFQKRMFDLITSVLLIGVSLPLWIVIAFSIKLTSPGPIFFRQERVGKYGKKFILYKFRSMVEDAVGFQDELLHLNEMDGPAFKIKNDPRQTITGRFLRKTSLDELPQLLNVFKGDISLVGPRPAIEKEVLLYHPWERKRLSVTQGITCIWQISGRNTIKFDEWMKLDLMYIENWSLASDYKILIKTVPAVLFRKGAY